VLLAVMVAVVLLLVISQGTRFCLLARVETKMSFSILTKMPYLVDFHTEIIFLDTGETMGNSL
jgi:hypothetical protein